MSNCTAKEIDRRILKLAWPAILSNITVPLLGLSDTFISGHLGSGTYLAAMAIATTMVNSIFWLFGFLRMGTTGLTATAFGRNDLKTQDKVYGRAMIIAFAAGLILFGLAYPLYGFMSLIMSPPDEVAQSAFEYFFVIMMGAPATLGTMASTGRLIGRQNTLYPMIISISVTLLNIALSLTLVFAAGIGFKGVALGTTISNWIGLILALLFVYIEAGKRNCFGNLRSVVSGGGWGRFFKTNGYLFIRSTCLMIVTFAMTTFASHISTLALAVNAVILQLVLLFSYFIDGFAFSGEALCGRFYGASDFTSFRLTVRRLLLIGVLMAALFAVCYGGLGKILIAFITEDAQVREAIIHLWPIYTILPLISYPAFIYDGIFVGITHTGDMMLSTLAGMILFFAIYIAGHYFGMPHTSFTLWMSYLIFLLTRGVILSLRLKSVYSSDCTHNASRI